MFAVEIDLSPLVRLNTGLLEAAIERPELVYGPMATTVLAVQKRRIFQDGLNSQGQAIGTYSPSYIRQRVRSGFTASSRVILTKTDQMRGDYTAGPTAGGYALGFQNPTNAEKARRNEERYGRVFALTDSEIKTSIQLINLRLNEYLRTR